MARREVAAGRGATGLNVRPAYRYTLAALVATLAAVAVGAWLGTRPPPPRVEVRERPATELPDVPSAVGADERERLLDRLEAKEAEELGPDEAADRRRRRERMLELRGAEHE